MKRVIIVTGASSGLGTVFAKELCRERNPDEVWLIARRKDRLLETAGEINRVCAETGLKTAPILHETDLANPDKIHFLAELLKNAGDVQIDTLVNNAGVGTYGEFAETSLDRTLSMVALNVTALTALTHQALPYMKEGCRIINVASLASFAALGNFAAYAATKSYVLSLSVALAAELKDRGITVTAACPGPVDTEFARVASNGARDKVLHGANPEKVVRHCLRAANKGKALSVMGLKWKFKAFMSRFIGRYYFARHTYLHEKRPSR